MYHMYHTILNIYIYYLSYALGLKICGSPGSEKKKGTPSLAVGDSDPGICGSNVVQEWFRAYKSKKFPDRIGVL